VAPFSQQIAAQVICEFCAPGTATRETFTSCISGFSLALVEAEILLEALSFFRRQIEVDQVSAEAARLPGAEGDARCHPDAAGNLGRSAEAQPEQ